MTDGAGALNVIIDSSATLTVTDGAGALNVIIDSSATLTVTDGAGALNVICDSGCSGGAQYTEDAAAAADPVGNAMIVVRADTPAGIASTNGDNVALRGTDYGAVYVTLLTSAGAIPSLATDLTVGTAFGTTGPGVLTSYKEFDGAALPTTTNVGTEEEANPLATTLQGVAYAFLVNEDGSKQLGKLEDDAHASADYGVPVWARRIDAAAVSGGTDADYSTFNVDVLGLLWTRSLDPCSGVAKTYIPINISTATTTELTAALAGASTNYYVCSVNLVAAAAQTIAIVYDDSDGCGSVTAGMAGGTSAATGWSFAANGGIALGNGSATVLKTGATNTVICAVTGQAAQISGTMAVVAAP